MTPPGGAIEDDVDITNRHIFYLRTIEIISKD